MNDHDENDRTVLRETIALYGIATSSEASDAQDSCGRIARRVSAKGTIAPQEMVAPGVVDGAQLAGEADDDVDRVAGADDEADLDHEIPLVSRKTAPRIRSKRNRPRAKTIALKRLTREELRRGALANPPVEDVERPVRREDCRDAPRPCPWVACKHHLYLDINPFTGSIKLNFPDLEPWELQQTCALDVAEQGALTLEEIGLITNLTRERVRQLEVRGLLALKSRSRSLR